MCGLLVGPQNAPFEILIWPQSMKNVRKKGQNSMKKWPFSANPFMKIGCSEVPKPSYLPLLWPDEWKMPAPFPKPIANITWSIKIWICCICSHFSTSVLFLQKEKSEWAMLMAAGPAMLGSYRKLVHICDTIKRKTYLFNLWKQEK